MLLEEILYKLKEDLIEKFSTCGEMRYRIVKTNDEIVFNDDFIFKPLTEEQSDKMCKINQSSIYSSLSINFLNGENEDIKEALIVVALQNAMIVSENIILESINELNESCFIKYIFQDGQVFGYYKASTIKEFTYDKVFKLYFSIINELYNRVFKTNAIF